MSTFKINIEHRPILGPEQIIQAQEMQQLIRNLPLFWKRVSLDDYEFYTVIWDDWRKVIEDLQPRAPTYRRERTDCEFFSRWFYVHVCEDFGLNTMAIVRGDADTGKGYPERHGWNVFTDGKFFYQLEPQNGEIMDIDDPRYVPDEIIIG